MLSAQEVTLRLHQFLPPPATVPKLILKPWAASVEEASGGRIKIEHYDAMALGGTPPSLMDQAIDGTADIVMTVVGYTPGRFPRTEVFELPFMMTDPVATSQAYMEMVETDMSGGEYDAVKVLGAWVHGPGVIHTKDGVSKLEDMEGLKLRGPTRVITDMLKELGATPVGMPLPAIPEALSKGVVDGTVIPWEVTPAIKLTELVENHTEFTGDESLYTATIVAVMNKDKYNSMPEDLRAILDEKSGQALSKFAAEVMLEYDAPGRAIAVDKGNTIVQLDAAEVARWKEKAQPVIERWVADMDSKGIDGNALIEQAKELIKKYGG
ncbi:TRAP transporter substrate-binding protein [Seohaeicola saemankumensis]|nr:TRAP transporter substrate-binding protein [Seohaeicola saemankumensis]MCA0872463.1 TRAP transporter substrate-binding protein [Seohaeicola saemankumensis]